MELEIIYIIKYKFVHDKDNTRLLVYNSYNSRNINKIHSKIVCMHVCKT